MSRQILLRSPHLVEAYKNAIEAWRVIPAFHWCLRTADRAPELFDRDDTERLLFFYGWAVGLAVTSYRVALSEIDALLDDMERRFRLAGHSLKHVYHQRCFAVDVTRGEAQARPWFARWQAARPGPIGEPDGYALALQGVCLSAWEDDEAAIPLLERVFRQRLISDPELPLSALMLPYLRRGRVEEAGQAHVRAYRAQRDRTIRFSYIGDHLDFCALSGHLDRGLDILTYHLPGLNQPTEDRAEMWVAASAALLCRLASEAGLGERAIDRPVHGPRQAATVTVTALGDEFASTALEIAARFDERDRSDHTSLEVKRHLARQPLTEPFPLPEGAPRSRTLPGARGRPEPAHHAKHTARRR